MKEKIKQIFIKTKYHLITAMTAFCMAFFYATPCYATGIGNSIYVTGTKKLLKDGLAAAQVVIGLLILVLWVVWEIQKRMAEDNEDAKYSKKQKSAIVGLILAETIATLFGIIGGYYGFSV